MTGRCADVAEAAPGVAGGAAEALLSEPGRTTTRSAARHEAGDVPEAKPDPRDTVMEGDGSSYMHSAYAGGDLLVFMARAQPCTIAETVACLSTR